MSPERISNERTLNYLKTINISLIAIDEAHCVSVWGNDFRPDYVKLAVLKESMSSVPVIALTATADKATQDDICNQLKLNEPKVFLSSFERTNITTYAYPAQKRIDKIAFILREYTNDSGIIYCLSRKETEKVSQKLNMMGL